ncbi:tetratricopeptide repeat protein [Labrys wisconsinensis]|uniref:Tetratricopeptide (TPR) repeat protein n=1 Tax=Labrys wisconsinensis TaxID=425677 RepID=A0ABU0J1D7_9HYPH|nr:hypothetical protein [Labrys wisconsinensis]MDQ0468049.1 tetratricopeptide (TPR) repeat protein [Labrys wisconsinensis]
MAISKMKEIDDETYESIKELCADGDKLFEENKYDEALDKYNDAWVLVPKPKEIWSASTWILAAIGDVCFAAGYSDVALEALTDVMHCPDAIGNPFLHLRRGQVLLDRGEEDEAADELTRAYALEGKEIFDEESPHYFEFLKTRIRL